MISIVSTVFGHTRFNSLVGTRLVWTNLKSAIPSIHNLLFQFLGRNSVGLDDKRNSGAELTNSTPGMSS